MLGFAFGGYTHLAKRFSRWIRTILTPTSWQDQHLEKLQRLRAGLGIALLALVVANRSGDLGSPTAGVTVASMVQGAVIAPFFKGLIALPCFVVAVLVLSLTRPSGRRWASAVSAFTPVATALTVALAPVVALVTASLLVSARNRASADAAQVATIVLGSVVALASPVLHWGAWRAVVLSVRHTFRARDAHPYLPAAVGIAVAAITALQEALQLPGSPPGLATQMSLLSLAGACVVAALSVYELRRLHSLGVTWATTPVFLPGCSPPRGTPAHQWLMGLTVLALLPLSAAGIVRFGGRTPVLPPTSQTTTYAVDVPLGHFRVPARVSKAEVEPSGMRVFVTYTNATGANLVAGRCPAISTTAPSLVIGRRVVMAIDSYCRHHPKAPIVVRGHHKVSIWARFPADTAKGAARRRVTLRWPTGHGSVAATITLHTAAAAK